MMDEVRHLIAADPDLSKNLALLRSITGFGEVSATVLLAELPTLAFHPLRGRNLGQLRPTLPTSRQKRWRRCQRFHARSAWKGTGGGFRRPVPW